MWEKINSCYWQNGRIYALIGVFMLAPVQAEDIDQDDAHAPKNQVKALKVRLKQITDQREQFLAAERALTANSRAEYSKLLGVLKNYPLLPNLLASEYSRRLKSVTSAEIEDFLSKHGFSASGESLRNEWLSLLYQRQQWSGIVRSFDKTTTNPRIKCISRLALYHTAKKVAALEGVREIWLTTQSLSPECNAVIALWHTSGKMTSDDIWDRIELSFTKARPAEAHSISHLLPKNERFWVSIWHRVFRQPESLTQETLVKSKHPVAKRIMAYGIVRLARNRLDVAQKVWESSLISLDFSRAQKSAMFRAIGLSYAYRGSPEAIRWLSQVSKEHADDDVKDWRVRVSIAQEKWADVLVWIKQLDKDDREDPRWQYWHARALAALGKADEAEATYREVAKSRSFEGFLASDRLGIAYTFENRNLYFPDDKMLHFELRPGILRARELYYLERRLEARREWWHAIKGLSDTELRMAALLAHRWGWHDRVILTLGKSKFLDDLKLRFPLEHKETVIQQSGVRRIDPAWAMAVIRRESAFAEDAVSHQGARGLMQLMPATAREVARSLKTKLRISELYGANLNIKLGVAYLKQELDKFGGHSALATAAYNAGGGRVTSWLPNRKAQAADIWIETIPFRETRDYCRNVMAYTTIYEQRMGLTPKKLTDRLPPIQAAAGKTSLR